MKTLDHYWMHLRYHLDSFRDLLQGAYFGGVIRSRYSHLGAHATDSSFYHVISRLFAKFPVKETDVLVDVGCGKGRVIHWWLRHGCRNRIIGIELDSDIAGRTRATFSRSPNVQILTGNVLDHIPPDGTLFYLYNPFNGQVMEAFKERLKQVCTNRHDLRIYYANCSCLDAFKNDPEWEVATNCRRFLDDPDWPVEELQFGLDYPVAIIRLRA